jgi:CRISPR-associated endoribonuclease Cas6
MRLLLTLQAKKGNIIPVNYQYPLSAIIYKILDSADQNYARFLHDTGYQKAGSLKSFKFFTFSNLKAPFKIQNDRLFFRNSELELLVSFHLPLAAENFIKGLFQNQEIDIADKKSKAIFTVSRIETLPLFSKPASQPIQEIILTPMSPVVSGMKNEKGNYDFLSPDDSEFTKMLLYNWREKYAVLNGAEQAEATMANAEITILPDKIPPKSRLITIKANTPAETKIRGFLNFQMQVKAPTNALKLLLNSGAGLYNSLGFGYVA